MLDEDEKADVTISDTSSNGTIQNRKVTTISESGLYVLVIRSNKPNAKLFRKWVTSEVLPQIRKTGGYIPINETMSDSDIVIRALQIVNRTVEEKDAIIKEQQRVKAQITTGREGTLFSKVGVLTKENTTLNVKINNILGAKYFMTDIVREIGMSAKRANQILFEKEFHIKVDGNWIPKNLVENEHYLLFPTAHYTQIQYSEFAKEIIVDLLTSID
jgi:prophage antirepressor-like protein